MQKFGTSEKEHCDLGFLISFLTISNFGSTVERSQNILILCKKMSYYLSIT